MYNIAFCYTQASPSTKVRGTNIANVFLDRGYIVKELYFYSNRLNKIRFIAVRYKIPYLKTFTELAQIFYVKLISSYHLFKISNYSNVYFVKSISRKTLSKIKKIKVKHQNINFIYDFDDAVWLDDFMVSSYLTDVFMTFDKLTCDNIYLQNYISHNYGFKSQVVGAYYDQLGYYKNDIINHKQIVIGWVGSKTTYVYVKQIRKVLISVLVNSPQVKLLIVGTTNVEVESDFNPVLNQIEVIENYSAGKDMYKLFNQLDIGLFPCNNDEDGNGRGFLKPILYMACGVVPVVSYTDNIKKLINHNVNGLISNNHNEWATNLNLLINNSCNLEKMKVEVFDSVKEKHCIDYTADSLLSVMIKED